ncbi:hypothetical protein NDU88_006458 [Pleurodeles waltl]|uniref:Uncharacterized protein n=1 Tax=Pleurodeles waltl TaxID=8319 RepID=A0AAV7MMD2_PLEWA|nr:hypothetical protein NDU88_006458 [Pleurodeles waltl]
MSAAERLTLCGCPRPFCAWDPSYYDSKSLKSAMELPSCSVTESLNGSVTWRVESKRVNDHSIIALIFRGAASTFVYRVRLRPLPFCR